MLFFEVFMLLILLPPPPPKRVVNLSSPNIILFLRQALALFLTDIFPALSSGLLWFQQIPFLPVPCIFSYPADFSTSHTFFLYRFFCSNNTSIYLSLCDDVLLRYCDEVLVLSSITKCWGILSSYTVSIMVLQNIIYSCQWPMFVWVCLMFEFRASKCELFPA